MHEKTLEYLEKNRYLNIGLIDPILKGTAVFVYEGDDGVALYNAPDGVLLISADPGADIDAILKNAGTPGDICVIENHFTQRIKEYFGWEHTLPCTQVVYEKKELFDLSGGNAELRDLPVSMLDYVYDQYGHSSDRGYIEDRIRAGMIGAFVNGQLAGFIGTHGEGAMGILHVVEEYRRQGIGELLEKSMINRLVESGRVPYAQIVIGNEASMALQKKLGLSAADGTVTWIFE